MPWGRNDRYPRRSIRTGHHARRLSCACPDVPTRHIPGAWTPTAPPKEPPGHILDQRRRARHRMGDWSRTHLLGAIGILGRSPLMMVIERPALAKKSAYAEYLSAATARKPAGIRHPRPPENLMPYTLGFCIPWGTSATAHAITPRCASTQTASGGSWHRRRRNCHLLRRSDLRSG